MLTFNQFLSEARIKFAGQRRLPTGRTITTHTYGRKENPNRAGSVETDVYTGPTGKKIVHVTSYPGLLDFPSGGKVTPHLSSAARATLRAMKVAGIDPTDKNVSVDYGMDTRDIGGSVSKQLPKGLSRVFSRFGLPTPKDRGTHKDLGDLGLL